MSLHANYPPVVSIHAAYCQACHLSLQLNFEREACWMAWLKFGWTADDLRFVVACLRKKITAGERRSESLMFRNLIRDTGRFEEDLAHFRALARIPHRNAGKSQALLDAGRTTPDQTSTARSASQIIAEDKALAAFRAFKETL